MLEINAYKHTHTHTQGVRGGGDAAVRHIIPSMLVSLHSRCQIAPVWVVPSVIDTDAPCAPLGRFILAASRCFVCVASHNSTLTNSGEQTHTQRPRQSGAPLSPPPVSKRSALALRWFSVSVENHCQNISVNLENAICASPTAQTVSVRGPGSCAS